MSVKLCFSLAAALVAATAGAGANPVRERADGALKGIVRQAERRDRALTSVGLFNAAYCLLRANRSLDKIDVLLAVAEEMQEKDSAEATFGNFRWYWRDGYVMDHNAVDFCMQEGALIARDWRKKLTDRQRQAFDRICERAIVGAINHRVRSSYTNIALMNAANLVLLGEAFGRPDAFDEGVKRLDDFILTTALFGVCEYASPTYTAVDLDSLHRLHEFVRDPGVRDRAERLLRLFWSDVLASSFLPTGRLAGAHSRDYDYLYGLGGVAHYLRAAGFAAPLPGKRELPPLRFELSRWRPGETIRALAETTPRFVESMWGEETGQVRTLWTGRHVSLGIAGANYWNMDIPLAVDFAATNRLPRAYFIADGRRDPYGMKKIPEGRGPHEKTIHLRPFWAGVQREREALGLAVYRPQDIPPETPTLESHVVFPSEVDEVLVNDSPVAVGRGAAPFVRELAAGDALFVRLGAGACGVRVVWSRDCHGKSARVALVCDGTADLPVWRLTVAHHDTWGLKAATDAPPGAAVFVRVSDEADDPVKFAAFRRAFAATKVAAAAGKDGVSVRAAGEAGPLELAADEPFVSARKAVPEARRAVLAVNGRDIGSEILGTVPGVEEYRRELARQERELAENRIVVTKSRAVSWEAEKGVVAPRMAVGEDGRAKGGKYVWAPGERGGRGFASGSVSWQLMVKDAGVYRLWARILTPTSEDDSFYLTVRRGEYAKTKLKGPLVMEQTEWHAPLAQNWAWAAFPVELKLPAGPVVLTLSPREDGAKMDCLRLSSVGSDFDSLWE